VRGAADGPLEAVLVLGTEGAPQRARKPQRVSEAEREPVPTARATVVRPEPFASAEHAEAWLFALRGNQEGLEAELRDAIGVLNRALRAHRLAVADPFVPELSADRALVVRVGYGRGDAVADGRFGDALELPRAGRRRVKRSMEAPEERFAALLGVREQPLVAEELVLRARADLDAGRPREAALQARVALEALAAARPDAELAAHRDAVGAAANAALEGDLDAADLEALTDAVEAMEASLRRHRLGG
jgi:hypothetical protein